MEKFINDYSIEIALVAILLSSIIAYLLIKFEEKREKKKRFARYKAIHEAELAREQAYINHLRRLDDLAYERSIRTGTQYRG